MVVDVVFPIYEVLVEDIFGSVGLAVASMAIVFALILMIGKAGRNLILTWILFFAVVIAGAYVRIFLLLALIGGLILLSSNWWGDR